MMKRLRNKTLAAALLSALLVPATGAPASTSPSDPLMAMPAMSASAHSGLGIVADGRRAGEEGVLVVAVSPDSAGERMGVRVGDRLLAVNGRRLAGALAPNALIAEALAERSEIRLELERNGETLSLAGDAGDAAAVAQVQPQADGCGHVSTVGSPPRLTRNIFDAEITQINGESTPLEPNNRYRVPAGRQVLVVRESIDRHRLDPVQRERISRMQGREGGRAYKTLVIDVEPGLRYTIGAELLPDRLDTQSIRANAWWQPVAWESRPEACR